MTAAEREAMAVITRGMTRVARSLQAFSDGCRLVTDAMVRAERHEQEFPDAILSDEERDAIEARSLLRTLADIDELPEVARS